MDADLILAGAIIVIVGMLGGALFFLISIRDKVGDLDRRFNTQTQRFSRILGWLESKKGVKRKGRDED
tara:strand:- start:691 stop:894 length:204 start_codon:yes stop_codon:yes gene_type:complete